MKDPILTLCLFGVVQTLSYTSAAQGTPDTLSIPRDASTRLVAYAEVVPVENATQAELYARGKVWFAQNFKSAKDVIQADDKQAGILVGKGWQEVRVAGAMGTAVPQKLNYTIRLALKDGRYRYELTDFSFGFLPSATDLNPATNPAEKVAFVRNKKGITPFSMGYRKALDSAVKQTTDGLKVAMTKPAAGGDW